MWLFVCTRSSTIAYNGRNVIDANWSLCGLIVGLIVGLVVGLVV